jgi:hypothetical protein
MPTRIQPAPQAETKKLRTENYSHLITSIGSVRLARRAGINPATQTTAAITKTLASNIAG